MARYHVGKYAELFNEYDRLEIPITATSQSASPKVAPSTKVYEQMDLHGCSLDKALTEGKGSASYHSPSPQSMKMVGVAWTCLDSLDGGITKVKQGWLSLLCQLKYLMIDNDAKNEPFVLVSCATPFGVILLEHGKAHLWTSSVLFVSRSARQGVDGLTLVLEAHFTTLVHPVGSECWVCSHATAWFAPEGKSEPILKVAALSGFKQFNEADEIFGLWSRLHKTNPLKSKLSTA